MLKGTNFGIQEQFPDEIEKRRKPLYPILRTARRNQQRAAIVKDKLYVDGKEVSVPLEASAGATGGAETETSRASIPMESSHL